MQADVIERVQKSFVRALADRERAASLFYRRLFEIAPQFQPMFPDDMTEQKAKLMQTLAAAIVNLHRIDEVRHIIEDLGRKHLDYGVKDEDYDAVGAALLYALGETIGEEFTQSVEAAWVDAYAVVAGIMRGAAASDAAPAIDL